MNTQELKLDPSKLIDAQTLTQTINELYEELQQKKSLYDRYRAIHQTMYGDPAKNTTNGKEFPHKVGEFVIAYLKDKKDHKDETRNIISAYASHVHEEPETVRNNISNTLTRLKYAGKIDNKPNKGGRRYGSSWKLKGSVAN